MAEKTAAQKLKRLVKHTGRKIGRKVGRLTGGKPTPEMLGTGGARQMHKNLSGRQAQIDGQVESMVKGKPATTGLPPMLKAAPRTHSSSRDRRLRQMRKKAATAINNDS